MNDLDDKWETDEDGHFIRTERDGEDLIKSSREACYICQRVHENQFGRCHTDNHAILSPATEQHPWFHLEVCSEVMGSDFEPRTEGIFVIQETDEVARELGKKALGSDYTGSEEVLRLAGYWLESQWYPTRLLQLIEDHIRLAFTSQHRPSGPYATLSHRWGAKPFECLMAENITTFEAGVPIARFPLTFQHVMRAAQSLGIQYLWFDTYYWLVSRGNSQATPLGSPFFSV
jgi:hypothetical protein